MNQIIAPIKFEETSEQVANLQAALAVLLPALGFSDFKIPAEEIKAKKALDATRKGIQTLQEKFPDAYNLELAVDELMASLINGLLEKVFTIKGKLTDMNGQGLSNHTVLISEFDIDQTVDLGGVGSNADGSFSFSFIYKPELQDGDGSSNPDLLFSLNGAFGQLGIMTTFTKAATSVFIIENGSEKEVAHLTDSPKSPIVLMNVAHEIEVRIAVGTSAGKLTEFEKLIAQLSPFMRKTAFVDLQEDESHFQISFLSKESGASKAAIEKLKNTFIEERDSGGLPAWAFFGLANLPLAVSDWPTKTVEEFKTILKPLQPSTLQEDLTVIAEKLINYAKEKVHAATVVDLKTSASAVLKPLFKDNVVLQDDFFNRYAAYEGDIENFWSALATETAYKEFVPKIQLNLQLSQLTLGNVGLIDVLQKRGIESTKDLVAISDKEWQKLAALHPEGIPDHIDPSAKTADRAKVYANELQTLVELIFPTEVIKSKIATVGVKSFLESNPDFDFTTTPIETFLHKKGDTAFAGITDKVSVTNELRQTQRLYAVTASAADTKVLSGLGFGSAAEIAQMPFVAFEKSVAPKIPTTTAQYYHAKASSINDSTTAVYVQMHDMFKGISPGAVGGNLIQKLGQQQNAALNSTLPNWENLFGTVETCECEHCRSVYSPAAYFVDLLHILLSKNARTELFRRRPDLQYTKLSCEHTDTLMPYIDLVNEILETYVAQSEIGTPNADTHAKDSINDTSPFTASELAANPQHPNGKSAIDAETAYGLVSKATFPLSLPFDLPLETGRQFLLGQNSSRFELLTTFGNPTSDALFAEALGLSAFEFKILVNNPTLSTARDLYGYSVTELPIEADLGEAIKPVREFLDRTHITYTDLIALVKTRFLNEGENIVLVLNTPPNILSKTQIEIDNWQVAHACDLKFTIIVHKDLSPLTDAETADFNRFIRLWKKLGCTIQDLDILLSGLGKTFTAAILRDLSSLWQLMQKTSFSAEQAIVLVSTIPIYGEKALYERLFLNKAILKIDDKLGLNNAKTDLEHVADSLEAHTSALLAAFMISEEELNAIATLCNINMANANTLNLANLSKIYRNVLCAKINNIKIIDFVTLLGFAPHQNWTTIAEILENQVFFSKIKNGNFQASALTYIFENKVEVGSTIPPKETLIKKSGNDLQIGLANITDSATPKDGVMTSDFLKSQLGTLLEEKHLTQLLGILDGSNRQVNLSAQLPSITDASDLVFLQNLPILAELKPNFTNYLSVVERNRIASATTLDARQAILWQNIKVILLPILNSTFIKQHIVTTFKTDADLAAFVLSNPIIKQDISNLATYKIAYIDIFKCLWLAKNLQLTAKELTYFQANSALFDGFDWRNFSKAQFASWLRIYDYAVLRNALPASEQGLIAVFEAAQKGVGVIEAIEVATGFNKSEITYFVQKIPAPDFTNEKALIVLQKQMTVSQTIGVSIAKLDTWSSDNLDANQAKDIKRTLKTKYDEDTWIAISEKIHNQLRNVQRDALVAYLLQKPEIKTLKDQNGNPIIRDANGLHDYFLMDVEMDACMKTSRLKQAISAVQLFVQRCVMNLENTTLATIILPTEIDQKKWEWSKNYRVWEANRKVFLFPENWIYPELRDKKTPFFKELESELLQSEVTTESVERALVNYLHKLDEVARLDICGMYEDTEAQELHVFGRTFNSPPQYFYRKLDLKTHEWTAWEKVQLDIQGNEEGESAGVHLIPVVWNRRLYLFWPIFTEKSDTAKQKENEEEFNNRLNVWQNEYKKWKSDHDNWEKEHSIWEVDYALWYSIKRAWDMVQQTQVLDGIAIVKWTGDGPGSAPPIRVEPKMSREKPVKDELSPTYYEIKMAWSEYKQNRWSPKYVSQTFIRTFTDNSNGIWNYRFLVQMASDLTLKVYWDLSTRIELGEFWMNCKGKMASSEKTRIQLNNIVAVKPYQSNFYQSHLSVTNTGRRLNWEFDTSLALNLIDNTVKETKILNESNQEYKLQFSSSHNFLINSRSKFFYQDQKHNYYVEPVASISIDKAFVDIKQVNKAAISHLKRNKIQIINQIDKGDPAPMEIGGMNIKFSPNEITGMLDANQISTSQALALNVSQRVEVPPMMPSKLPVASIQISEMYSRTVKKLNFQPFFHAYVCNFIKTLNQYGIDGLLKLENQGLNDKQYFIKPVSGPLTPIEFVFSNNFEHQYQPNKDHVSQPYPMEDVDFSPTSAYGMYNWELFFHVPMLIANRLSKNQKFEEAMRWYHFIFDPTTNDTVADASRYWQVIPLKNTPIETLESLMQQLNNPLGDVKRVALENAIEAWRKDPFKPHLVARMRLAAYQKNVLMKYMDNLIDWADKLFSQDTLESINQATPLYIMVTKLLGRIPEKVPSRTTVVAKNYAELETAGLNAFSNARVQLETTFSFFNLQNVQPGGNGSSSLSTSVPADYFAIPNNPKLLGYWDTIADRLFKIRHCQNIEGVERQLALFEPAIDPALLVQATAQGIDISSVLADMNAPMPHYRFAYILQKALEICSELKSMGNSLLSVLEKNDNEAMAIMRTQHETTLLNLVKSVKQLQIKEAQRSREGLEKTQEVTTHRVAFYKGLLETGLNSSEKEHDELTAISMILSLSGQYLEMAASAAHVIPDVEVGVEMGIPPKVTFNNRVSGGDKTGSALSAFGRYFGMLSSMTSYSANAAQTNAGYQRRADDWKQQKELAEKELKQIDKQILAAQIREQIAERDLSNHEQQIDNARQVEEFYRNKYTQAELYGWMQGEISTLYFQCYQLAYDLAKKAEKAYRFELGLETSNFVKFGVWDSFRKGLMSGEKLYMCLKQMEKAHMDLNRREFELTKHVSLALVNPKALLQLREKGKCTFTLPEEIFDLDFQGHYFRRIKTVSLSIPCIAGPYTTINGTLRLVNNSVRANTKISVASGYKRNDANNATDDRFMSNPVGVKNIAVSSAQNDNGMFDFNFRDERYLPFEGAGVISTWVLELTEDERLRQFDYNTISDAVLHLRYTAREDGTLKTSANNYLKSLIDNSIADNMSFRRLFSLRHDFPSAWHRFLHPEEGQDNICMLDMVQTRFPFFAQGKVMTVNKAEFHIKANTPSFEFQLVTPVVPNLQATSTSPITGLPFVPITAALPLTDTQTPASVWQMKLRKSGVANFKSLKEKDVEDVFLLVEYILQ